MSFSQNLKMDLNFGTFLIVFVTLILIKFKVTSGKPLLNRMYRYLCTVVASAKKAIKAKREQQTTVKRLENYSDKMMKWSEECVTDYRPCDEEDDADDTEAQNRFFLNFSNATKSTQTEHAVETRTHLHTKPNVPNHGANWNGNFAYHQGHGHPQPEMKLDVQAIRQIQERQCSQLLNQLRFLKCRDVKTPLLICVEANSSNISGYCINFKEMTCKFYIYATSHLPWHLESSRADWDPIEFKMKNLVFALLLWEEEVIDMKKVSIYSNCGAVNNVDSEYGKVAIDVMEHFGYCENVIRVNSNPQVSRYRDTDAFARLMQPARELVFWNLNRFRTFLKMTYGIGHSSFEGSHGFLDDYCEAAKNDGFFARSNRFHSFLNKVDKNLKKWSKGCTKCGFRFPSCFETKIKKSDTLYSDILRNSLSPQP